MESLESRRHHFEVEKELASRLRRSTRAERKVLASELYAELYRRVPDHPRIARSQDAAAARRTIAAQMRLVRFALKPEVRFLEFGAGTGAFSREVAPLVSQATALEVCVQNSTDEAAPGNYRMILHDGQTIPLPDGSVDVAFSYQVLEHLHPDDVDLHLEEISRILAPGGMYILSTPHSLSGPHDVSRYFTESLETFHLKEWTYGELSRLMHKAGFKSVRPFLKGRTGVAYGLLLPVFTAVEHALGIFPKSMRVSIARKFLTNVVVCALKSGMNHSSAA